MSIKKVGDFYLSSSEIRFMGPVQDNPYSQNEDTNSRIQLVVGWRERADFFVEGSASEMNALHKELSETIEAAIIREEKRQAEYDIVQKERMERLKSKQIAAKPLFEEAGNIC